MSPSQAFLRAILIVGLAHAASVTPAQFTPGRLVILQTSTGPNTGVAYTLREITTTGTFGFQLTIPTTGSQQMWSDADPLRPDLNLSAEGDRLLFPGYAAESPITNPPFPAFPLISTSGTACPRAVGQVDAAGVFTRIVTSTTLFSGTRCTAVTSVGNTIWGSGNNGVNAVGLWAPGSPVVIHSNASGLHFNVGTHGGQLFTARHASPKGIYRVGSGLPTTPGQVLIPEIIEPGDIIIPYDFKFNAAGTICYVPALLNGGLQKWVLMNGTWSLAYSFAQPSQEPGVDSFKGVEVDWSGPDPIIYVLATGPGKLFRFIDAGAPSSPTLLASAVGNERWTGMSWTPVSNCVEGTPCNDNDPNTINDAIRADCQCGGEALLLSAKVFLEGPYNTVTGLMSDALRNLPDFPLTEPFTALGMNPTGGAGTINSSVLTITGNNAIVDWILAELRDAATGTTVLMRTPALLQRDGDVVALNGTGLLSLPAMPGSYRVAIRHRNHLGVMTDAALPLSSTSTTVDLTTALTTTWGTDARKDINGVLALWSGEVVRNAQLAYSGANNDRDPILVAIGGTLPNNTLPGYRVEDVNMNGNTAYTGAANDRDPILVNVGSTTPNGVRVEQLP